MIIRAMILVEHEVDPEEFGLDEYEEIVEFEQTFNVEEYVVEFFNRNNNFMLYESDIIMTEKQID